MLLIARLFRCVSSKHNPLPNLFNIFELIEQIKTQRQRVTFIHVIDLGLSLQDIDQLCAAHAEQYRLRDTCRFVRIIKSVADRLREKIIFRYIGSQQEQRRCVEYTRLEQKNFYKDFSAMDDNRE